jgi:hypothetical protein
MRTKPSSYISRLSRPTASSAAREAASKAIVEKNKALNDAKASARTPSRLSMASQPLNDAKAGARTPSRLSMASQTQGKPSMVVPRAARKPDPESGTLQSVKRAGKGLRTKFSNMLGNRKSSEKTIPSRTSLLSEKANVRDFLAGGDTAPQRTGFRNLTTYENSGMSRTPSQVVHPYVSLLLREDVVEHTPAGKLESPNNATFLVHSTPAGKPNSPNNATFLEVSTPSASTNKPPKNVSPTLLSRLESHPALGPLPSPTAAATADRTGDLTDTTLQEAQVHFVDIIKRAEAITDVEARKDLVAIIEMLGASIAHARELRIATLEQISNNMVIATKVREYGERVLINL